MKKFIILIFTMVIILSLALSPVYAEPGTEYEKVVSEVNYANAEIDKMITEAKEKIEKLYEEVDLVTSKLDSEIGKIIDKLISNTEKISAKTIEEAAKNGFLVGCDYIEVEIGGQVILIDPLRILDI